MRSDNRAAMRRGYCALQGSQLVTSQACSASRASLRRSNGPRNRAGNGRQIGEPPAAVVGDIEPATERLDLLEQPHGAVQVAGSL